MRIRVEQELRDAFVAACQKLDVPAAQVLRQHMKDVVSELNGKKKNASLPMVEFIQSRKR